MHYFIATIVSGVLMASSSAVMDCRFSGKDFTDPDHCVDQIARTSRHPSRKSRVESSRVTSVESWQYGHLISSFGSQDSIARSALAMTDGSLLVGGRAATDDEGHWQLALAKFRPDGTLDTRFNTTGRLLYSALGNDESAHSIGAYSDGRFMIAGRTRSNSGFNIVVYRFLSDGSLDPSFNGTGYTISSMGTGNDVARAIAIDSTGRAVISGYYWNGSTYRGLIARYGSDGVPDASFGTNGFVSLSLPTGYAQFLNVQLDSSGSVWAGGGHFQNDWSHLVARTLSDGTWDTGFATTGYLLLSHGTAADATFAGRVDDSGRFIGAGISVEAKGRAAIYRLNPDGTADTSFNTSGYVINTLGTGETRVTSLWITTSGRIRAGGYASLDGSASGNNPIFYRLNTNGSPDTIFSGAGSTLSTFGSDNDEFFALASQSDQLFFSVGGSSNAGQTHFAVTRYGANGRLALAGSIDSAFGTSGQLNYSGLGTQLNGSGFYPLSDGRFYAIALTTFGSSFRTILGRYFNNGDLDTSFNTRGWTTTTGACWSTRELTVYQDNLYIPCWREQTIARFTSNGRLDTAFNGVGVSVAGTSTGYGFSMLAATTDGLYVSNAALSTPRYYLFRYRTDGRLDTAFNTTGRIALTLQMATNFTFWPVQLTATADGKPWGVSLSRPLNGLNQHGALIFRLNSNGSFDTSFASTGVLSVLPAGAGRGSLISAIRLETDGQSVLAIDVPVHTNYDFQAISAYGATRYLSNGDIDTSFAPAGRYEYTVTLSSAAGLVPESIRRVGNKYVGRALNTVGANFGQSNSIMPWVYRLNSDFSLDTSFAFNGAVQHGFDLNTHYHPLDDVAELSNGFLMITQSGGAKRVYP